MTPADATPEPADATALLTEWRNGNRAALDQLFPLVYQELRRRAHRALQGEAEGHTLTTTALVHETYLRLLNIERMRWEDRPHFLALAATAMRRVLVDYARQHNAAKRGGGQPMAEFSPEAVVDSGGAVLANERADQLLALDSALDRLGATEPRWVRIVEMRFFGGMTVEETAAALDLAPSTVKLDWQKAKTWLYQHLRDA